MDKLNLNAPPVPFFLVAVVLAVLGLIGRFVFLPFLTLYGFWILVIAFAILAAGCLMKKM